MDQQMASPLALCGDSFASGPDLSDDLIWGGANIGQEIKRTKRQAFHLLENGRLPARKIGGRWCASRAGLRQFFGPLIAGKVPS
jgi:hypothetical protein